MPAAGEWFEKTLSKSARRRRKFCRKKHFFMNQQKENQSPPGKEGQKNPPPPPGRGPNYASFNCLVYHPPGHPGGRARFSRESPTLGLNFLVKSRGCRARGM